MTGKASQIEYQKIEVKQGYKPGKNLEILEPTWKTDKDWKEFYMIHFN